MIQNFTTDFPPYHYLIQVAEHCPKAVCTYMALWRDIDKNNKVVIYKEDIRTQYLTSVAKFRHDLLLLVKEALISIVETKKTIHIEVVGWDIDAEGQTLC